MAAAVAPAASTAATIDVGNVLGASSSPLHHAAAAEAASPPSLNALHAAATAAAASAAAAAAASAASQVINADALAALDAAVASPTAAAGAPPSSSSLADLMDVGQKPSTPVAAAASPRVLTSGAASAPLIDVNGVAKAPSATAAAALLSPKATTPAPAPLTPPISAGDDVGLLLSPSTNKPVPPSPVQPASSTQLDALDGFLNPSTPTSATAPPSVVRPPHLSTRQHQGEDYGEKPSSAAPERDETPRPVVNAPSTMRRTKIIVIRELIDDDKLPALVPYILSFADESALRSCMLVNKVFMAAAVQHLYQSISLFGSCGPVLKKLLRLMSASADGATMIDYRSAVRSLEIGDLVLDEPEVTPLQSWNLARELIRRLSANLEHLYLDSDDPRFRDGDFIQRGTCGLDQRVVFPRIRSVAIAPGCLAFPDEFIYDLLRRCPLGSLSSIRLPGCVRNMSGTGYYLISERGGAALTDLILTPPNSFPPPATIVYGEFDPEQLVANATEEGDEGDTGGRRLVFRRGSYAGRGGGGGGVGEDGVDDEDPLAPYDPMAAWDPDVLADGLQLLANTAPNLRALDISGHTTGLRPGALETLLRGCEDLEELDLPCGVTDATLYELLMVRPARLWRLNLACSCHRCYTDPITPETAARAVPCSFITDGVVKGVLDEVLAGKIGALIELPTHVMEVKTAKMLPTLAVLEEVPGAKIDMNDTDGIYVPRIGVKAVVPNGRMLMQ